MEEDLSLIIQTDTDVDINSIYIHTFMYIYLDSTSDTVKPCLQMEQTGLVN